MDAVSAAATGALLHTQQQFQLKALSEWKLTSRGASGIVLQRHQPHLGTDRARARERATKRSVTDTERESRHFSSIDGNGDKSLLFHECV